MELNRWRRNDESACVGPAGLADRRIGLATLNGMAQWFAAMRWRRRVEVALGGQLSFSQWLILDAMAQLIVETGDAINQNQIAARLEISRAAVSQIMRLLERKWLVDRAGGGAGPAWRIWLTKRAVKLLSEHAERIEAASR